MTWYAQQIFAQPKPDTIAALRAVPAFANSIYHVPHLRDHETTELVADGVLLGENNSLIPLARTVRRGPQLPADGLLVIRELCEIEEDSNTAEWFGEDAVSWKDIGHKLEPVADPLFDMDRLFADAPDWWPNGVPPIGLLRQLRHIAFETKSVVSYYSCQMWGGDVECVFGWVWDGGRNTSCFYRGIAGQDETGNESTGFYTDIVGAFAIDSIERRVIVNGDVLTLLLIHFGVLLKDGYFELHTRSFDWLKYKLMVESGQ